MTRRRITIAVVIVIVVVAVALGFMPQAIEVETETVRRGDLIVTIEEEGRTRVIDRYVVSAPVTGYSRRLDLDVGTPVGKGELLCELEPLRSEALDPRRKAEAAARLSQAESALKRARESVEASRSQADIALIREKRIRELEEKGSASPEELDVALAEVRRTAAELRTAEFAVDVAHYEVEAARTALRFAGAGPSEDGNERVTVSSPIDGSILALHRESEGVVTAGQPLVEVGNPRALEVEVDVLSEDAVRIPPDARVILERWGGDHPLSARVRVIEPTGFTKVSALGVEEQRVLVISDLTSPPEEWIRLGDGYRVEAKFVVWEGQNVLQVPTSALFRFEGKWAVFVAAGDRARRRVVQLGHQAGLTAEIASGLQENEEVIVHPPDALDDGSVISVRELR